jgi:hypothetical protein
MPFGIIGEPNSNVCLLSYDGIEVDRIILGK